MTSHLFRRSLATCAVIPFMIALSACVSTGEDSADGPADCDRSTDRTLAIDYPYNNIPVYGPLKKLTEKRAQERGYTLNWTADNSELNAQVTALESLTAQRVPAIVTLPLEPSSVESTLHTARNNCTVVVSYATQLENEDSNIGLNLEATGEALSKNVLEWAATQPGPLNVFILNNNDLPAGKARYDGIVKGLAQAPDDKVRIVADQKATTPQQAATVAQQVLQANPEINIILGFNDDWALAGLQAMRNLGRTVDANSAVYVGGLDGSQNALQELKKGNAFRATVGFQTEVVANAIVDVPADILEGKDVAPVNELPYVTLVSGDPRVDQFLAELQ